MKLRSAARRRLLKGGLAAGSLFLPLPYAWVWAQQSDGAAKLLRLPKVALVLGNSAYKDVQVLKNPANDARAIGETLKASGFDVITRIDSSRGEMLAAMQAYAQTLASKQCVGLFYFAGHGVQLAWHNYLLPVDAVIGKMEDVQKQAVDIGTLLEGLTKAANPMNVIILDACRENPFGKDFRVEHRGLSQMDAPATTLLAYATQPGNVASDGAGTNGLYTENLLRELKVRETKIEDVFKRVRAAVRKSSSGAQIPWESTSLEEDFYFLPPKELRKLSEAETEQRYEEELALWDKTQAAMPQKGADAEPAMRRVAYVEQIAQLEAAPAPASPVSVEEYLRRYPSGYFSELAQLQLDRVLARQGEKRIQIASSAGNPFTRGSATANTDYKVGDTYTLRLLDMYTELEMRTGTMRVVEITDNEVRFNNGTVTDLLGNILERRKGGRHTPRQMFPLEYAIGKRWKTRFETTMPNGNTATTTLDLQVVARESITVPAGTFDVFRIEGRGFMNGLPAGPFILRPKFWMAPGTVRWPIRQESFMQRTAGKGNVRESTRFELVSFRQS